MVKNYVDGKFQVKKKLFEDEADEVLLREIIDFYMKFKIVSRFSKWLVGLIFFIIISLGTVSNALNNINKFFKKLFSALF